MEIDRTLLLRAFLAESEDELGYIEQAALALEANPGDLGTIDAVFRAAHTLKGNAATLSLDVFAELAHALEDVLDAVRSQRAPVTGPLTTLLLRGVDGLRAMLLGLRDGEVQDRAAYAGLIDELGACAVEPPAGEVPVATEEKQPGRPDGRWAPQVRLEMTKLDHLLGLATRVSVVQGQMGALLLGAAAAQPELLELHQKNERLLMEVQDWIMDARMVPIGAFLRAQARTVRDGARSCRKRARLQVDGERVRVDTAVGDGIRDAITHLVRNAVDHGIEPPAQRVALGKPAEGTITLRASQNGNQVVIQVIDDGAGLSLTKIRARARAMGRANVDAVPDEGLHRMIFEPGFSTAEEVTELSGRGVGMDVVLRRVESLHGTVDVESGEGTGTTIELRLPLTVSVIEGFWVDVAGTDYVLPLDDVEECLEVHAIRPGRTEREGMIELRDEPVAVYRMRQIFGAGEAGPRSQPVVVVRHERGRVGLAVDTIHGQRQTVIRPLGRLFRSVAGVSGSSLRPDGQVALVIDVSRLLRSVQRMTVPQPATRQVEMVSDS